jgi:hypothetical protein
VIEIKIQFDPTTGQVNFSGPMDNRLLMYGLLGLVQEAVLKGALKAEERLIQPAQVLPSILA